MKAKGLVRGSWFVVLGSWFLVLGSWLGRRCLLRVDWRLVVMVEVGRCAAVLSAERRGLHSGSHALQLFNSGW